MLRLQWQVNSGKRKSLGKQGTVAKWFKSDAETKKKKNDTNFKWQTTLSRNRIWMEFRREAPAVVILTSAKQVGVENN